MVGYNAIVWVDARFFGGRQQLAADQAHSYFWVRWILTDAIGRVKVNISNG
jgi:hypothetical protein